MCECPQEQNTVVRTAGENRMAAPGEKLYSHVDLVQMLGIVNLEAGSEVRLTEWALQALVI